MMLYQLDRIMKTTTENSCGLFLKHCTGTCLEGTPNSLPVPGQDSNHIPLKFEKKKKDT